jgi:hypothetical protein
VRVSANKTASSRKRLEPVPRLAALFPGVFVPHLRNAECSKIRHPIQWNAATGYDVVRPGNCIRRVNNIIHPEDARICLLKHNFRAAGNTPGTGAALVVAALPGLLSLTVPLMGIDPVAA